LHWHAWRRLRGDKFLKLIRRNFAEHTFSPPKTAFLPRKSRLFGYVHSSSFNQHSYIIFSLTWARVGNRLPIMRTMRYVAKEARWKVNGELVTKHFVESRINGKRERLSFDTKAQAKAYADARNVEILNEEIQHATFSAAQRILAQECADKLAPFGKTLRDATDFLLEHLRNAARSCTATQLVAELLAAKKADGVGAGHRKVVELRLAKFAEHFNGKVVSEITSKEIDQWLRSLQVGKRTRSHYRAHLVNAFNFAVRCGYASSNVAEGATKVKVDDAAPVGILTVEETARLLEAATPDILPMIAIGLFAGLRRSEIARLTCEGREE